MHWIVQLQFTLDHDKLQINPII